MKPANIFLQSYRRPVLQVMVVLLAINVVQAQSVEAPSVSISKLRAVKAYNYLHIAFTVEQPPIEIVYLAFLISQEKWRKLKLQWPPQKFPSMWRRFPENLPKEQRPEPIIARINTKSYRKLFDKFHRGHKWTGQGGLSIDSKVGSYVVVLARRKTKAGYEYWKMPGPLVTSSRTTITSFAFQIGGLKR